MTEYAPLPEDDEAGRVSTLASVLDMDDEVLRGIALPALLANRAQLFEENGRAARDDPKGTFALSRPVESLSYFVSHSWRTSRLMKHLALCVHFNLQRAAIASAAANLLVFALQLFCLDALPSWLVVDQVHVADYSFARGGMLCEFTGPLVFIPVLLFGHIFDQETTCFLDIACISQDDERKKATGIASLGAILDRSERMLVLCDGNCESRGPQLERADVPCAVRALADPRLNECSLVCNAQTSAVYGASLRSPPSPSAREPHASTWCRCTCRYASLAGWSALPSSTRR